MSSSSTQDISDNEMAIYMDQASAEEDMEINMKLKPPEVPVFLQFKNICFHVKDRLILDNVSGHAAPGEFLAIMGPTGSGKTTLLSILARRLRKNVTGDILANGVPPTKNFKRQVGFVQQEDILFQSLTVFETLEFTAKMRLPESWTEEEKIEKVNEVINNLNLTKAKDTIIGGVLRRGVSGGERKRVNIANQMLTDPALMFLDEPTSGLDTSTAYNMLKILKTMSSVGMTIISVIHQPSSQMFELFDKLLFLVDGQNIYFGKADEAVSYFSKIGLKMQKYYNPADFMMGLILKEEIKKQKKESLKERLIEEYKKNIGCTVAEIREEDMEQFNRCQELQKTKIKHKAQYPVSAKTQFVNLTKRSFRNAKGEYLTWLNFFQIIAVSVISGLLWFQTPFREDRIQDLGGSIFFNSIFPCTFFPALLSLFIFPPEKPVIRRERSEGTYRLSLYYLAKLTSELPFELLFPFLYNLIVYWLTGYRLNYASILLYYLGVLICPMVSTSLGIVISSIVENPRNATVIMSVILLLFMLSAGFYVRNLPVWLFWISYISTTKYIYNLFLITQFKDLTVTNVPNYSSPYHHYDPIPGNVILNSFNVTWNQNYWINFGILIGIIIILRFIGFFLLKRTLH